MYEQLSLCDTTDELKLKSETWKAATASSWLSETHGSVEQHSVFFLRISTMCRYVCQIQVQPSAGAALTLPHRWPPARTPIPFSCFFTNFIAVIFFFKGPAALTKVLFFF